VTVVPTDRVRRNWADENLVAAFALLARHRPDGRRLEPRRFGAAQAFPGGRRGAYFNPVIVLEEPSADDLRAAVEWARTMGSAPGLRVRTEADTAVVRATAAELELEPEPRLEPAFVLAPIPAAPSDLPAGMTIEVATASNLETFYEASVAGFEISPEEATLVRELTPPSVLDDPGIRMFTGLVDGRPAASSIAIRSDHAVGIYSVSTAPWARRRGVGTAMTWAAIAAGIEWGCPAATLQSSRMGEPVYRAMGFADAGAYVIYAPRRAPAAEP
jgi:hypothetical protein